MSKNDNTITTFHELMDLIAYDWGFDKRNLERFPNGEFSINKTYITSTEVSYKTERWIIKNPIVYHKLNKFYELLQETELEKTLYEQQ